jgi:hypothetical protein
MEYHEKDAIEQIHTISQDNILPLFKLMTSNQKDLSAN